MKAHKCWYLMPPTGEVYIVNNNDYGALKAAKRDGWVIERVIVIS